MSDFTSSNGRVPGRGEAGELPESGLTGGTAMGSKAPGSGGLDHAGMHSLRVEPSRSMKAVTSEVEVLLADLDESSRRGAALLASELIAQVIGRAPSLHSEPVALTIQRRTDDVRLEATGPVSPEVKAIADSDADTAEPLADWGRFILDSLADRWGIAGGARGSIWAEIAAN